MPLEKQKNHPKNKILNCEDFIFLFIHHFELYKKYKNKKVKYFVEYIFDLLCNLYTIEVLFSFIRFMSKKKLQKPTPEQLLQEETKKLKKQEKLEKKAQKKALKVQKKLEKEQAKVLKKEQKKVNAFIHFHFTKIFRGKNFWYPKLMGTKYISHHEGHLHAGDFDTSKVTIKKL